VIGVRRPPAFDRPALADRRGALEYLFLPRSLTRDIAELIKVCFCRAVELVRWSPGDPWEPPHGCAFGNATVYGGLRNCRLVAHHLGGRMLEPALDFLPALPEPYRKRDVKLLPLERARDLRQRAFFKPAVASEFPAKVYASGAELEAAPLPPDLPVLVSEVVDFEVELRTFVLDRQVRAWSAYAAFEEAAACAGDRREGLAFARRVAADRTVDLPRAVVLDVGRVRERGWAVVEANPALASGIYGCDPAAVLEVLRYGIA
jgi:hypothetical protein